MKKPKKPIVTSSKIYLPFHGYCSLGDLIKEVPTGIDMATVEIDEWGDGFTIPPQTLSEVELADANAKYEADLEAYEAYQVDQLEKKLKKLKAKVAKGNS